MPDPTNPADLPASWLPGATQAPEKPAGYRRAVARKVKNDRWQKVLKLTTVAEDICRRTDTDAETFIDSLGTRQWKELCVAAGVPSSRVPSDLTRAEVAKKLADDLAAPYRAKGRG